MLPDRPQRTPQLISRLSFAISSSIASKIAILLSSIFAARYLSVPEFGAYLFITSTASLMMHLIGLGISPLSSVNIQKLADSDKEIDYFMKWSYRAVSISGLTIGTIATIILPLTISEPAVRLSIILCCWIAVPMSLSLLGRGMMIGFKRSAVGIFLDEGTPPIIIVMALLAAFLIRLRISGVELAVIFGLGACLGAWMLRARLPKNHIPTMASHWGRSTEWLTMSIPLLLSSSSKLIMDRVDVLMLGPLAGFEQVGSYGAAYRVTYMLTFPQVVFATVFIADFATFYTQQNVAALRARIAMALGLAATVSGGTGLLLILFAKDILTLSYGPEFTNAASILVTQAIGQVAMGFSVPLVAALTATDRSRTLAGTMFLAVLANAALNWSMIPRYGAIGAATATTAVAIALALALLCEVLVMLRSMRARKESGDRQNV